MRVKSLLWNILFILIFSFASRFAGAATPSETVFREYHWGDSPDVLGKTYSSFYEEDTKSGLVYLQKEAEELSLEGVKLSKIYYIFWKSKLFKIYIEAEDSAGFSKFAQSKLGNPKKIKRSKDIKENYLTNGTECLIRKDSDKAWMLLIDLKLDEEYSYFKNLTLPVQPDSDYLLVTADKKDQEYIKALEHSIDYMKKLWKVKTARPIQVFIYPTRGKMKEGLIKEADIASDYAKTLVDEIYALASGYKILLNKKSINRATVKNEENSTICHEVVHIFQHSQDFTNGFKDYYLRCLEEGYAYLVSNDYIGSGAKLRKEALASVKVVPNVENIVADIMEIETLPQYNEAFDYYGAFFKKFMIIAADYLLKNHGGHQAFAAYFAGGPKDAPPQSDAFEASFGITKDRFREDLIKYLKSLNG